MEGPNMAQQTHANYLHDLGWLLKERALETREPKSEFDRGRRMAYYEVLSSMKSLAATFGVPASDVGLADLDPDRDLLG
jgi:hypothetical protein